LKIPSTPKKRADGVAEVQATGTTKTKTKKPKIGIYYEAKFSIIIFKYILLGFLIESLIFSYIIY
jgi:hypothetical protein